MNFVCWIGFFGKILFNFLCCESGCGSNGITDVSTNLLMKVQRDAMSESRNQHF